MAILVQADQADPDAGLQLLDSPDCALRTDRRQAASEALIHCGHEHHPPAAAPLSLRLSQQCAPDSTQPCFLRAIGLLAVSAGGLSLLLNVCCASRM